MSLLLFSVPIKTVWNSLLARSCPSTVSPSLYCPMRRASDSTIESPDSMARTTNCSSSRRRTQNHRHWSVRRVNARSRQVSVSPTSETCSAAACHWCCCSHARLCNVCCCWPLACHLPGTWTPRWLLLSCCQRLLTGAAGTLRHQSAAGSPTASRQAPGLSPPQDSGTAGRQEE